MPQSRSAGILLHVTSLPSRFGIGDMGPSAFEFVDFLDEAGQSVWQILPLCPTTAGNSPYSSYSAFAGNMLLLSPEALVTDGWLGDQRFEVIAGDNEKSFNGDVEQVDFELVTDFKRQLLAAAFEQSREKLASHDQYQQFCQSQAWWLEDFARFEALREHFGESNWTRWPEGCRAPSDLNDSMLEEIKNGTLFSKFKQFLFERQWNQLKRYANVKGVQICGDMPIFVAFESADVWANQDQFLLDPAGDPKFVAGVPPDYFSATGQLWGNPLYDWQAMESDGFAWWCNRFSRALNQFDILRVDHFRGFDRYWKIPADAETAAEGTWENGPGDKPFTAARQVLGDLPIWAEDLGDIDQAVHDLRDRLEFPPMRVLQFGYADADDDFHRHTTFPSHCIAYTGTHDNDTLMGWFQARQVDLSDDGEDLLAPYLNDEEKVHFQIIKLLYQSAANVAIIPLQDALGLDNSARMNVPGVAFGNWTWRSKKEALTEDLAKQLRIMTVVSGRLSESRITLSIDC